jgi:hypothetical protein
MEEGESVVKLHFTKGDAKGFRLERRGGSAN